MPHEKIMPQQFMLLSREMRNHIAQVFDIKQSGITEVRDNDVISDGRTAIDLEALSKEAMTEYVGSEESFGRLWELTIAKAHSELHPPVGVIASAKQVAENNAVVKTEMKKRGRPAKSK